MVDVSGKTETRRRAVATGRIAMTAQAARAIGAGTVGKGDVLATARIAGILAAKRTGDLIPLCHPLSLDSVTIDLTVEADGVSATAAVSTTARTGVEMEAMTAVSLALLTIYDMAKAVDKGMEIGAIRLVSKTGGKSGDWPPATAPDAGTG